MREQPKQAHHASRLTLVKAAAIISSRIEPNEPIWFTALTFASLVVAVGYLPRSHRVVIALVALILIAVVLRMSPCHHLHQA